jgi:hypothetical protein
MIAANPTYSPLPAPNFKSAPVSDLCALCVSAFSSPSCFSPNSFRIRTYAKRVRNPFTMNTSKTQDLKPFRMNTYEKTPGGRGNSSPLPPLFPLPPLPRFRRGTILP